MVNKSWCIQTMECFTTVDLPVATKTDKHYRRNPQNIVECVGLLVSLSSTVGW